MSENKKEKGQSKIERGRRMINKLALIAQLIGAKKAVKEGERPFQSQADENKFKETLKKAGIKPYSGYNPSAEYLEFIYSKFFVSELKAFSEGKSLINDITEVFGIKPQFKLTPSANPERGFFLQGVEEEIKQTPEKEEKP